MGGKAIMKITCPNCGRTYHVDEGKIPSGVSFAKCKDCKHSILLRPDPPKIPTIEMKICEKCGYERKPEDHAATFHDQCPNCGFAYAESGVPTVKGEDRRKEGMIEQAQQASATESWEVEQHSSIFSLKGLRMIGAIVGVLVILLIGIGVALRLTQKSEDPRGKSQVVGKMPADSDRSKDAGRVTTVTDEGKMTGKVPPMFGKSKTADKQSISRPMDVANPFVNVNVNIPALLQAVEKRLPEEEKDLKYNITISILNALNLERVRLFLYLDPEHYLLPVVLLQGRDERSLQKFLSEGELFKPFLEYEENGCYRLKKEAMPDVDKSKFPIDLYRICLLDKGVVLAPDPFTVLFEKGGSILLDSQVARFAKAIEAPQILVTLTIRIPENIQTGWEKQIINHPSLEDNPEALMIAGLVANILLELSEPLKQLDFMALGFRFSGEKGRELSYAQQFRKGMNGTRVYERLKGGKWKDGDIHGMVMRMVELLKDERFNNEIGFENNQLTLHLNWSEKDDQGILEVLSEATIGYLIAQSLTGGGKPSEGPIEARYVPEPRLVAKVDGEKVKTEVPELLKHNLFPGRYWNTGGEPYMMLECDPIDVPNAPLAQLTYEVLAIETLDGKNVLRQEDLQLMNQISLGSVYSAHLRLPIQKGTPTETLRNATIRFNLSVPLALQIFDFKTTDAEGSTKDTEGVQVQLMQLEKDVAEVTFHGSESARLFAFDKTGRALASSQSMGSKSSIFSRFQGIIQTLKVALVTGRLEHSFKIDVDLNGGKPVELAHEPGNSVPVRYERGATLNYANYDEQELDNLQVEWTEGDERSWNDRLSVTLPKNPSSVSAFWEVHFFGKDKPLFLSGDPDANGTGVSLNFDRGRLKEANAVFGKVQMSVSKGIKRLTFDKKTDGAPMEQTLSSGAKVVVAFNKNEVAYTVNKAEVIQTMAYNAAGKRLRMGNYVKRENDRQFRYFWGQPATFVMDAASEKIHKLISFEIVKRPVNEAVYQAYKKEVQNYREIVNTLKEIDRVRNRAYYHYGEDIAGLYYLYDRNNEPLQLIERAIAHSDPAGQARFGYTLKPYKGYYFTVSLGTEANGVQKRYQRQSKEKKFTWQGGTFSVLPFRQRPDLVAIPEDKSQPTYSLMWEQIYMKEFGGSRQVYLPENVFNSDWAKASFITE
jgi:predicted Zn finger-like uncharacterized protein